MDEIIFRLATADDIPAVVAMLADDPLGRTRESPDDLAPYRAAFADIAADPREELLVADDGGAVVGTAQLTFLPGLSRRGALRAQIEAVRVDRSLRGAGLGSRLIEECVRRARERDCVLVQLTSDTTRSDAHRFYGKLGFEPTHVGFKLALR
ncbi:GNAT superfamily N-acetyltransferase [Nocardia transvalensis]|uniref:GNAT superfamily N-acetyltransferase n=1 Tax=Nocardia transvalensis TaxID=37333 RepID=A0A7W9PKV2_9NOCA|nr:GNAT family N-acetyltransferase [Nocardia transvalensis]MBB5917363.1 GNAT superfamily N-acetyltransferase [Nocardia transvalensis]